MGEGVCGQRHAPATLPRVRAQVNPMTDLHGSGKQKTCCPA